MKRKKSGFTLAEVLLTVGILAVLLAIAVPSVMAVKNDLDMMERNAAARSIFLAAQNNLTARQAAGTLAQVGEQEESAAIWLRKGGSGAQALLPTGAIETETAEGYDYLIRLNLTYATVLEVYCVQGGFTQEQSADIESLIYSDTLGQECAAARRAEKIGYYNGGDVDRQPVEQLDTAVLTIENGETLKVTVRVPNAPEYLSAGVTLAVRVAQADDPARYHDFSLTYDAVTGAAELVLDGLLPDAAGARTAFRDLCPEITPGAQIRVTATLEKEGSLPSGVSAETNSLFAARQTEGGTEVLAIANARHLQNLNHDFSGVEGTMLSARQTESISWPDGLNYQSIVNRVEELGQEVYSLTAYQGNGLEIRGLHGENGLFGSVKEMSLTGIRVVNPVILGNGDAMGALAGRAEEAEVTDCGVYVSDNNGGKPNYGSYGTYGVRSGSGGVYVGGLMGYARGCKIDLTLAALPALSGNGAQAIGGLIGCAEDCAIAQSSAAADQLSGSGNYVAMLVGQTTGEKTTIDHCYAVGNLAALGLTRFAGFLAEENGSTAAVTDSYCAVTYDRENGNTVKPYYAFSVPAAAGNGCAYLDMGSSYPSGGTALSFEKLREWGTADSAWGAVTAPATHPYRSELDGQPYPFPALADQTLGHYGSWPVQAVDGIRLFNKDGEEIKFVLLPSEGETLTFYAGAFNGGTPVNAPLTVGNGHGTKLEKTVLSEYDPETGLTQITITSKERGVDYIDISSGSYTLLAVVVVYETEVTLNGTAASKVSTTSDKAPATLILSEKNKKGIFTAEVEVKPVLDSNNGNSVKARLTKIAGDNPGAAMSAELSDFAGWETLKSGDPAVTANGSPAEGTYILAAVNGNYYPTANQDNDGNDSQLTVTGAASGTAAVSARWAMDERVEARINVKVEGARALIQTVRATGTGGAVLGEKNAYPYRLDLTAEPGEEIALTFSPQLFGAGKTNKDQSYTWTVARAETDGTRVTVASGMTKPSDKNSAFTCTLADNMARATYTAVLEYNDAATGDHSVDYMTFTVYRAAKKSAQPYLAIQFAKSGGGGFLTGTAATVEQINGNGYNDAADLTLQGWVSGAGNPQVKWSYSTDQTNWSAVTGQLGSLPVYETVGDTQRMRATVQWMNTDQTYQGNATGGAILITGLDANEYDSDFTFYLRAEAAEAMDNGQATSAARTVTVTVMRKLQIDPQSKTATGWFGIVSNIPFSANRQDGIYALSWTWNADGTRYTSDSNSIAVSTSYTQSVSIQVACGPHTATATLTSKSVFQVPVTSINEDGVIDDRGFFLIEKGKQRTLDFAWSGTLSYYVSSQPSGSQNMTLTKTGGSTNSNTDGNLNYSVLGRQFTKNAADSLTWKLKLTVISSPEVYTYDAYVVGMDVRQNNAVVSDSGTPISLSAPGAATTLTADWSFPAAIRNGAPTITWEIDNPDLIAFSGSGSGSTASGDSVTIVAKQYSVQGYSATVKATCTVNCVNGRTYTYTKYVSVIVPPQGDMALTMAPCAAGDVAALNAAFGDGLTADSLLAAVDEEGQPVLIRDPAFGCDTLYLKLQATGGGSAVDLKNYFCDLYVDQFYAKMTTALSGDGKTLYLRLQAAAANASPTALTLRAAVGSAKAEQEITLYDVPSVVITTGDEAGVTVVTNGSTPVYLDESALSLTLTASLTPTLYRAEDTARTTPLDTVRWTLQAPAGYDPEEYLTLIKTGNTASVSLRTTGNLPDFRVVIHAASVRSDAADAGYALVFLPEKQP